MAIVGNPQSVALLIKIGEGITLESKHLLAALKGIVLVLSMAVFAVTSSLVTFELFLYIALKIDSQFKALKGNLFAYVLALTPCLNLGIQMDKKSYGFLICALLSTLLLFFIAYVWKDGVLRKKNISGALCILLWSVISFGLIFGNILLLAVAALFTFKVTGSI
ncbi:hypothetical protein [Halobacteriovorax sp.]|uniref:hypothetical protein n=1 Tax=Halobacteriovorax sp. TaxID=2020862 RepID=UPI003AF1FE0B